MTIYESIEKVTDWLNQNVCPKIKLKLPDDEQNGDKYKVEAVNPTAFAMYQPGKDKLPPNVKAPFPSVVVQLLEGTDDVVNRNGQLKLQLSFTVWNPGDHETGDGFVRNADGWRDVWVFVDRTLREIENTEYLNGLRVVKELNITFGQFQQEGQISDLYPYWGAWVILTVERGIARTGAAYSEYL